MIHTEKSISRCGHLWQVSGHFSLQIYTMTPTKGLPSGWYRFLGVSYHPRSKFNADTCYEMHDNLYYPIEYIKEQVNFRRIP